MNKKSKAKNSGSRKPIKSSKSIKLSRKNKQASGKQLKRNVKDTVFTNMFGMKEFSLELYKSLHPEDKDVVESDIKTITLKPVITKDIYNDLGMLVKNKIIILVEAQSTWSVNILWRHFFYLAETFKNLIGDDKQNLYGSKKVELPIPEVYILYTGTAKIEKDIISLNEEFYGGKSIIDLKARVITDHEKYDIIKQYIEFAQGAEVYKHKKGSPGKLAREYIELCIEKNILRNYLIRRKMEVVSIMELLFDQDVVTKNYEAELYRDGMEAGMKKGMEVGMKKGVEDGMKAMLDKLVKNGVITKKQAKDAIEEK